MQRRHRSPLRHHCTRSRSAQVCLGADRGAQLFVGRAVNFGFLDRYRQRNSRSQFCELVQQNRITGFRLKLNNLPHQLCASFPLGVMTRIAGEGGTALIVVCMIRFNAKISYGFCTDLRTNSDYFHIQGQLTGFCNGAQVCFLRGRKQLLNILPFSFCP
jgi:hypothetical protein